LKSDLLTSLYVFMLAAFIGFEVIRRVSPLLHTPLMSLTNALDAIAVVGAIILAVEIINAPVIEADINIETREDSREEMPIRKAA